MWGKYSSLEQGKASMNIQIEHWHPKHHTVKSPIMEHPKYKDLVVAYKNWQTGSLVF